MNDGNDPLEFDEEPVDDSLEDQEDDLQEDDWDDDDWDEEEWDEEDIEVEDIDDEEDEQDGDEEADEEEDEEVAEDEIDDEDEDWYEDDEDLDGEDEEPNENDLAAEADDEEDEEGEDENEDEEGEVSLEQLSAAYAEVLKNKQQEDENVVDEAQPPAPVVTETPANPGRTSRSPVDDEQRLAEEVAACPISPASILEAILFVGGPAEVKLTSRKIAAVMRDVSPKEVTATAKQLAREYLEEGRAFRLVSRNGTHHLELHPEMAEVQQHFLGRNKAARLTQQAIDVLAVVAYHQPVTREAVNRIRGKSSGAILNQMVKRDLLQFELPEGSREKLFSTTDRFLDLFGLDEIEDLPHTHDVDEIDEFAD